MSQTDRLYRLSMAGRDTASSTPPSRWRGVLLAVAIGMAVLPAPNKAYAALNGVPTAPGMTATATTFKIRDGDIVLAQSSRFVEEQIRRERAARARTDKNDGLAWLPSWSKSPSAVAWYLALLGIAGLGVLAGFLSVIFMRRTRHPSKRPTESRSLQPRETFPRSADTLENQAIQTGWLLLGWDAYGNSLRFLFDPLDLAHDGDGLILGRNSQLCHIVVVNNSVSRRHIRLTLREDELMVEDLNTTNGTYLNGQRLAPLKPSPLRSGDSLILGDFFLRFIDQSQEEHEDAAAAVGGTC